MHDPRRPPNDEQQEKGKARRGGEETNKEENNHKPKRKKGQKRNPQNHFSVFIFILPRVFLVLFSFILLLPSSSSRPSSFCCFSGSSSSSMSSCPRSLISHKKNQTHTKKNSNNKKNKSPKRVGGKSGCPLGSPVFKKHVHFKRARGPRGDQQQSQKGQLRLRMCNWTPINANFREAVLALFVFVSHYFSQVSWNGGEK